MLVLTRNLEGKNASVHGENLLRLYLGSARKTYESELKTLSKTDLIAVDTAITSAYKNPEVFERAESQSENWNPGQVPKKAAASEPLDHAHSVKPWEKDEHIYSDPLDPYRACNQALDLATQGDPEAIHRIFISAYVSESDPVQSRGEDGEGIVYDHEYLLATLGDQKFAEALTFERPEVVSAVRIQVDDFRTKPVQFAAQYPETHKILSSAPKIDFTSMP